MRVMTGILIGLAAAAMFFVLNHNFLHIGGKTFIWF